MTEEAAPPPRPGSAQPGGSAPPPPTTTPTEWTEPSTFGPHAGTDATAGTMPGGPADGYPPPTAGYGPGPGFAAGTGYGPGGTPPGPGGPGPSAPPPPPGGTSFTSRYGLVRPREGRYLAGVCAAIGRATNTDPVLWRVLLAVLGFFGGIGILVYVAAWLIIPNEGDTASPVESMLGRGRSSMSPVTVIVLGILVAASFAYIVTDAFRAVLLGAAILVAGALLLNRDGRNPRPGTPGGPQPGAPSGTVVPPVTWPAPSYGVAPSTGPAVTPPMFGTGPEYATATTGATPTATIPGYDAPPTSATHPVSGVGPVSGQPAGTTAAQPGWPSAAMPSAGWPSAPVSSAPVAPAGYPTAPPPSGYRPPFAPHGPYASPAPAAPPPPKPPKPPKRPKERSPLGAVTFSLIFLVLGLVALLDLLDVFAISASAYFAAALATIALGLLVGTWFGRARWLIALGLVTAAALGTATVAESYDRIRGVDGAVTWAPTDYRDLADRYENSFGDAVLDLRGIDFAKRDSQVTVAVNFGQATVVVPPNVDVTTVADVNAGDATIFGNRSGGLDGRLRESTDVGADGPGGGTLRLYIHVNAGNLEVTR
ncbi:phage shock protein PspC (stress-responsive transcriptional regulator) [Micromonospora vinacea]|uniref:Phage shock protein PspC (Stress-responsive transcriptional regulator) n=1 Tax=Micromonospora vinacea TaxID=709878 RepID=A0ABS0JXW2_9ACTN|nr:PspC domain-containing protein [Micromonospora vinacea]MBG6100602.1 phage shock protein PspC (stress-responsive transcriptional regulator) [Micromonospora vinacea]